MLALAIGLAGLSALLAGFTITCGIWLHSANAAVSNIRDTLDAEQAQSAEWEHKYEAELLAHAVTLKSRDQERELRAIAEKQRNEAQSRVRDLLRSHLSDASEDEIREITSRAFSAVGVVSNVPEADDPDPNRLLRPGDEL